MVWQIILVAKVLVRIRIDERLQSIPYNSGCRIKSGMTGYPYRKPPLYGFSKVFLVNLGAQASCLQKIL